MNKQEVKTIIATIETPEEFKKSDLPHYEFDGILSPVKPVENSALEFFDYWLLLELVNEERRLNDILPLQYSGKLNKLAKVIVVDTENSIRIKAHFGSGKETDPYRNPNQYLFQQLLMNNGYDEHLIGENALFHLGDARNMFNAWKSSPGHLANMLKEDFKYMGFASHGTEEASYAVQLFSS